MSHRQTVVVAGLALCAGLLAGGGGVASGAPADPCGKVYTSASVAKLKAYTACRANSQDAALARIEASTSKSVSGAARTKTGDACDKLFSANSVARLKVYLSCREDRQDAALKRIESRSTPLNPAPTVRPTSTATSSPTSSPSPTATTGSSIPTGQASTCVGAANTPGGADPWGGCWPGPQNTGYPHGLAGDTRTPVSLTAYTGPKRLQSCGVVIDSKVVDGDLLIQAGNGSTTASTPCVTIRNSLVKGVIYSEKGSYGPTVVSDTEISPAGISWWENVGRTNMFVTRVDSHGSLGVIKCEQNCTATDSYVHGMRLGGTYHYNAFGSNGMSSGTFVIRHNWASCGDWATGDGSSYAGAGCSAAIGFYGDFDPVQNITLDRNYLVATHQVGNPVSADVDHQGSYCLNPGNYPGKPYPSPRNMAITDNVFGLGDSSKCGVFGPSNSLNAAGHENGTVWSGNRWENGEAVDRPVG